MDKIELMVADIHAATQPSEAFSLILKEKEGDRYVPVIIGMSEARAILVELNQSPTHRPLTHELFASICDHFRCQLLEVNIVHYENGVYFADMVMKNADGTTFTIDSRPSDAIALALKAKVSFYMNADIFNTNSLQDQPEEFEEEDDDEYLSNDLLETAPEEQNDAFIEQKLLEMSNMELETLLEGAVASEDFELAEKIQQELDRRK
ncbi:MAG: bifunctional nuclease family protein [Bacteroidales bacterium]|nr:bifunctional nuclease family protein [Bacteroidales bacterium]